MLGRRLVSCRYVGTNGEKVKSESEFVVAQWAREPVLIARKVKSGGVIHLANGRCYMQLGSKRIPVAMPLVAEAGEGAAEEAAAEDDERDVLAAADDEPPKLYAWSYLNGLMDRLTALGAPT